MTTEGSGQETGDVVRRGCWLLLIPEGEEASGRVVLGDRADLADG